jgi:AcrR family transcriptional regulator
MRADPEVRHQQLMDAAIQISKTDGWSKLTRTKVAAQAQVAASLINFYFGDKEAFRTAVMAEAVSRNLVSVVAEGLLYRNEAALNAPPLLRKRAEEYKERHKLTLPRWRKEREDGKGVVHAWTGR